MFFPWRHPWWPSEWHSVFSSTMGSKLMSMRPIMKFTTQHHSSLSWFNHPSNSLEACTYTCKQRCNCASQLCIETYASLSLSTSADWSTFRWAASSQVASTRLVHLEFVVLVWNVLEYTHAQDWLSDVSTTWVALLSHHLIHRCGFWILGSILDMARDW